MNFLKVPSISFFFFALAQQPLELQTATASVKSIYDENSKKSRYRFFLESPPLSVLLLVSTSDDKLHLMSRSSSENCIF